MAKTWRMVATVSMASLLLNMSGCATDPCEYNNNKSGELFNSGRYYYRDNQGQYYYKDHNCHYRYQSPQGEYLYQNLNDPTNSNYYFREHNGRYYYRDKYGRYYYQDSNGEYHYQKNFSQNVDNSELAAQVRANILADSEIQNFDISVQNFNGHIVLDGYVASSEQKFRAAYVAGQVTGVRSVTNHLVVRKG